MMVTNKKMQLLIEKAKNSNRNEMLHIEMNDLAKLFSPNLKRVYDCIIVADEKEEELVCGFDKALKMYTDKTGYEASHNETPISLCFDGILDNTAILIALMVIDIWALKLKQIDKESRYCFILSAGDGVELRFHKVRDNEKSWLASDLETYDGPVGFDIR